VFWPGDLSGLPALRMTAEAVRRNAKIQSFVPDAIGVDFPRIAV
jgi:hypothetical protein